MPPFPPLFAYVIFGFLWLLEVIFTLFVITLPISWIIALFSDILLIFWLWLRIGPEMIIKFKNPKTNKKFIRRFLLQFGAEFIPIVNFFPWNVWFIYNQHKDEVSEFKVKEAELDAENSKIRTQNKETEQEDNLKKEEFFKEKQKNEQEQQERDIEEMENAQIKSGNVSRFDRQWMRKTGKVSVGNEELDQKIMSGKKKEGVGKIKKEDLPDDFRLQEQLESPQALIEKQTDYSRFETYEQKRKEELENKKTLSQKAKQNSETKQIKVQQAKIVSLEKEADKEEKRYGTDSNRVISLKERARENNVNKNNDGIVGFDEEKDKDLKKVA